MAPNDVIAEKIKRAQSMRASEGKKELRKKTPTKDWITESRIDEDERIALVESKRKQVTHFYEGVKDLRLHVNDIRDKLRLITPAYLSGTLIQPDGTKASRVIAKVMPPKSFKDLRTWPNPMCITTDDGKFKLKLPLRLETKVIKIRFEGSNGSEDYSIETKDIPLGGLLERIQLKYELEPMPQSILGSLQTTLEGMDLGSEYAAEEKKEEQQDINVVLGEKGGLAFDFDMSRERMRYGVLVRLVEPQPTVMTRTLKFEMDDSYFEVALRNDNWNKSKNGKTSFKERVPIDEPINVDAFRDQLIGNDDGYITASETIPMAGTLGLGYVVRMSQEWKPKGLSLGNLSYSLPLAPGEQQRIAVYEKKQTQFDYDQMRFDVEDYQSYDTSYDTSAQSVFSSSFDEHIYGRSSFDTYSKTSSAAGGGGIGFALGPIVIGGGGGGGKATTNANGYSSSALDGSRNYVAHAAEESHSRVEREAYGRRRANETHIRLASATDKEKAVTKVITNNNRAHALTVQYWEVLRQYDVSTAVNGVTLVCFVPMDVLRFLPAGELLHIDPDLMDDRGDMIRRYSRLASHADVLKRYLPWKYRNGLNKLEEFVANPKAQPEIEAYKQDVVDIKMTGTFLPMEDVYVSVRTKYRTVVGAVRISGGRSAITPLPQFDTDPQKAYSSREELMDALYKRRTQESPVELNVSVALPASISPDEIIGFDITRRFHPVNYKLAPKEDEEAYEALKEAFKDSDADELNSLLNSTLKDMLKGVYLRTNELEQALGGPMITDFKASLNVHQGQAESLSSGYITSEIQLPSYKFPIPALSTKPLLKFNDVLEIEKTLHHVIRNTVYYSKLVWKSLSAEERAIMLEGFTIGVPAGGVEDDTQDVPLLNCIGNKVLGFYGNSMIMPFNIPADVSHTLHVNVGDDDDKETEVPMTTGLIQDALTEYHRKCFSPPVSKVALPTRGVLGEAVLGQSPSAEKIDLTRFWNWQDSPIDKASNIEGIKLGAGKSLIPDSKAVTLKDTAKLLEKLDPVIASTALAQKLADKQPDKGFTDITGRAELKDLLSKSMDTSKESLKASLSSAQAYGTKAMDSISTIVKDSNALADKKEEAKKAAAATEAKKKSEAAAKEEVAKKEAETKREEAIKGNLTKLTGNAKSYMDFAESRKDQDAANAYAKSLVSEILGEYTLTYNDKASLYSTFNSKDHAKGSPAFLKALGIQ